MKGMKYMPITTNVSTFANTRIDAYRELAKKATETGGAGVDSQDSGVVAALKRFFYKLDFLLKYGQFPSVGDTAPDALPPELQELKTFLETPQDAGKSYILQKDINTRYRFTRSDTDTSQITVTEERRYVSPAGARTGYACNDKWRENDSQPCEKNELLSSLNGVNQTSAKKTAEVQTSTEKPAEGQAPGVVHSQPREKNELLSSLNGANQTYEAELARVRTLGVVHFSDANAPAPIKCLVRGLYPKMLTSVSINAATGEVLWDDGSTSVLRPGSWEARFFTGRVKTAEV